MHYTDKARAVERYFDRIRRVIADGYGGTTPDWYDIDRRAYPEARPIEANPYLGIPEPKPMSWAGRNAYL